MNKENKAKLALTSNKGVNAICVTSDGSAFDAKQKEYADAHSQRFEDQSIAVFGVDGKFGEDNKNLLFDGSKWSFKVVEGLELDEEPNNDENGSNDNNEGDKASMDMSKDELQEMAKDLEGFKTSLTKAELVELING